MLIQPLNSAFIFAPTLPINTFPIYQHELASNAALIVLTLMVLLETMRLEFARTTAAQSIITLFLPTLIPKLSTDTVSYSAHKHQIRPLLTHPHEPASPSAPPLQAYSVKEPPTLVSQPAPTAPLPTLTHVSACLAAQENSTSLTLTYV